MMRNLLPWHKAKTSYLFNLCPLLDLASTIISSCKANAISLHALAGTKPKNYAANSTGSVEELWQAFFANPMEWWDNRKSKVDLLPYLLKYFVLKWFKSRISNEHGFCFLN